VGALVNDASVDPDELWLFKGALDSVSRSPDAFVRGVGVVAEAERACAVAGSPGKIHA
jgi:hypothetical protein